MCLRMAALVAMISFAPHSVLSQGTFQNLDFESVPVPLAPDAASYVSITNGLPSWSGFVGTNAQSSVFYNYVPGFLSGISLLDTNSSAAPIQGIYHLSLFAGASSSGSGFYAADVFMSFYQPPAR